MTTIPGPVQQTSPTFLGMPPFPEAAREALGKSTQRRNLHHATHTIRAKRAAVVGEVDQWEQLRLAGEATKDEALRHLPHYLEQLEERLTARGATVHWARDAAEANRIVIDIARAKGAEEVVKVKSMATQEIELNEAFASQSLGCMRGLGLDEACRLALADLVDSVSADLPVFLDHRGPGDRTAREVVRRLRSATGEQVGGTLQRPGSAEPPQRI